AEEDADDHGQLPSASILSRLPCVAIEEEEEEDSRLNPGCAICKDSFSVGSLVKQLPCFHLYHPRCISRWLSTKNTCPLCRYQLPTDNEDDEYSSSS
ncbi:hypothetical protein M569_05945, partial [Genlisea aurea]